MLVNRNNYILDEIPRFVPLQPEYKQFWKEQKRLCIEGMWSGGRWIPGTLYHFINSWNIEIKKDANDKYPTIGIPLFRDVELDIHIAYNEARGFSRFEGQTLEDVKGKHPRDIMLDFYLHDLGRPLYENEAKNMIICTGRGLGKSFNIASIIGHEFTFIDIEKGKKDVVVGAYDPKYSDQLLSKIRLGFDHYPGSIEFNNVYYPSPFYKRYRGSWNSGKEIEARYDVYRGRHKIVKGDGSKIQHRNFKVNIQAGVGGRPSLIVLEEAGAFNNLEKVWNANMQAIRYGNRQFGTMIAIGTGGDMFGGTIDLSRMFYEPEIYNCVTFEDTWENKGSISLFIPAHRGLNEFKDDMGNTIEDKAHDSIMSTRNALLEEGASRDVIEKEMQYRPEKPSEMFLISSGSVFPRILLQEHLSLIENNDHLLNRGQNGKLEFNADGKFKWIMDKSLRPINDFPLKDNQTDRDGCIVIWEHPYVDMDGRVPSNLYIAGLDPVDQDKASNSPSLFSIHIYKRFFSVEETYKTIVAEYVGRPEVVEIAYEIARRLLMYYNARCLYENMIKGFHTYMVHKKSDHYLVETPDIIRDIIKDTTVDRGKGIHMTTEILIWCEKLVKTWLLEEYAPGRRNLQKILSVGLLKELIMYSDKGNYDRCISFFLCLLLDHQLYDTKVKEKKKEAIMQTFFPTVMFTDKPSYFS